jgi:hypothetical protein
MNMGQALSTLTREECQAARAKPYQKDWEKDLLLFFKSLKNNHPDIKKFFVTIKEYFGMKGMIAVLLVLDLTKNHVDWSELTVILSDHKVFEELRTRIMLDSLNRSDLWTEKMRVFFNQSAQEFLAQFFVGIKKDFGEEARKAVIVFLRIILEAEGTL